MSNMYPSHTQSQKEGDIDLSIIFNELWENKRFILFILSATLSIGFLYGLRQVPQYQSELLIQIESNRQGRGGFGGHLPQQIIFGSGKNNVESTQLALIKSRFILGPVVRSLGLDINIVPQQSRIKKFIFPSKARMEIKEFEVPTRDVNKKFILVNEEGGRFRLTDLNGNILLRGEVGHLTSNNDNTIRLWVNDIVSPPNTSFYLTKIPDDEIVRYLQSRLKIIDLGENKKSTGVLSLKLSDPNAEKAALVLNVIGKTILAKDVQKNAVEASKTLDFLYHQLPITKRDLAKSESELNQYRAKSGKIDIKLQSQHLLVLLSDIGKQLSELRINKIDMLQRHTLQHPFIIALNTKINQLNNERSELEAQLKKLPASDQIAVNLMRDVKVKNSLYMLLLNKIQELQVVKAGIVSDVRILTFAKQAHKPLPLKRKLIYLVSLLFGLALSSITIYVRKLLFPRVDDPQWSEEYYGLLNLAIVPYSKEQLTNSGKLNGRSLKQIPLLAYVSPRSLSIESLRSLRTTLQVKLSSETNNIVSILGVSPAVGKTFVSANLAYLLTTAGKRVVLIDTDMRRGTLHKYFNLSPATGLADVLNNKITLTEALKPTVHENLFVLTRGIYPEDPAELLTSENFNCLLKALSQQFDLVVIDTPPVLLVTDAVLISVYAGTNYLVMGAGAHQPAEIEMSIKRLSAAGVTLNGTIYNFHNQSCGGKYGYGYKYAYKYKYKYNNYYEDKEALK